MVCVHKKTNSGGKILLVECCHNSVSKLACRSQKTTVETAAVSVLTVWTATEVAGATHGYSVTCRQRYGAPGTGIPNPRRGGAAHRPSSRDAPRQAAHLHQRHSVGDIREIQLHIYGGHVYLIHGVGVGWPPVHPLPYHGAFRQCMLAWKGYGNNV
jgi:hypothetical protein